MTQQILEYILKFIHEQDFFVQIEHIFHQEYKDSQFVRENKQQTNQQKNKSTEKTKRLQKI